MGKKRGKRILCKRGKNVSAMASLKWQENYTKRIENEKYTTDNHDVGFMLYCSFVNGWRLTSNDAVSYTHLDVYKRQEMQCLIMEIRRMLY